MTENGRFSFVMKVSIALVLAVAIVPLVLGMWHSVAAMKDDYATALSDGNYSTPVTVEGVEPIEAHVSGKHAAIEMFSAWSGGDVTEDELNDRYLSRLPRFSNFGLQYLMNRWCPRYVAHRVWYASDSFLLKTIYEGLERGIPVPIEWSVKSDGAWHKEYALVTAMDVEGDSLTLANTEGRIETLGFAEFLGRMNGDAYAESSLRFFLAWLGGDYTRNTVYRVYDSIFADWVD